VKTVAENQRDLLSTNDDATDLLERVDEKHLPEGRWPQMLADFVDVLRAAYQRAGIDPDQTDRLARQGVMALSDYLGGRYFYLAKGENLKQALRDDEIWREFDGQNIAELAQRYSVSERHVYRVLAEQRAMRRKRRQGQLFPESS
jgi:Mor family transcriptional regulator